MIEQTDQHAQDSLDAKRKLLDRRLAWLVKCLTEGKIRFSASNLRRLQSLAKQLQPLVDHLENPSLHGTVITFALIPDNKRDPSITPIPESQLDDFKASVLRDPTLYYDYNAKKWKTTWRRKREE
ncbi:MAG: hypothetical protein ABII79_09325 [bacterium]